MSQEFTEKVKSATPVPVVAQDAPELTSLMTLLL
jgi:hypothetical protein